MGSFMFPTFLQNLFINPPIFFDPVISSSPRAFAHMSDLRMTHGPGCAGKQIDCWVKYVDEAQGKLGLTMIPRKHGETPLEEIAVGSVSSPTTPP